MTSPKVLQVKGVEAFQSHGSKVSIKTKIYNLAYKTKMRSGISEEFV